MGSWTPVGWVLCDHSEPVCSFLLLNFSAGTCWTPGKSPMSKSSPHSSDLTCQTGRSPSRSAITASTTPSSAPRWVFHNYDRVLRCHFPFNSIMQLTYFQSLFSGGVTIFRFIPIVSCHKCVLCVSPVLFLVFHLNTGSDSRQHSQMSLWILKATCLQTNTQKTQIIQGW